MRSLLILVSMILALNGEPPKSETQTGAKELFFFQGDEGVISVDPPPTSSLQNQSPRKQTAPPPKTRADLELEETIPTVSSGLNSLGLRFWIELVEGPGSTGLPVTDQRTFRSGEKVRLHFTSNRDGYLNILQLGSSGRADLLFPAPTEGLTDNFLPAYVERTFPDAVHWFRFDDQPGTENLIVVLASTRADLGTVVPESQPFYDGSRLIQISQMQSGKKDLVLEREDRIPTEIGIYAVQRQGAPIVLRLRLNHQ